MSCFIITQYKQDPSNGCLVWFGSREKWRYATTAITRPLSHTLTLTADDLQGVSEEEILYIKLINVEEVDKDGMEGEEQATPEEIQAAKLAPEVELLNSIEKEREDLDDLDEEMSDGEEEEDEDDDDDNADDEVDQGPVEAPAASEVTPNIPGTLKLLLDIL